MELIRKVALGVVLVATAGCGSPVSDLAQAVWGARGGEEEAEPAPALRPDRAAIEAADLAAIVIAGEQYGVTAIAGAIQLREDRVIFNSSENRSVMLDGGLIYTTRGFGENLQAVETAADDPLVTKASPADWPDELTRTYLFSGYGPQFAPLIATCRISVGSDVAQIDVVEATRNAVTITERCTAENGSAFTNQHFVDPADGEVWRTLQWTGPKQGFILVDVIEPFTG
ncbi:MAG: YjbF family lipoprotein [Pseudomonadota bacterium]